jgi:probable phosphoglycerate mutase
VTHGGVSRVARGAILGIEEARVPFLEAPQDIILKLTDGAMEWL